MVSRRLTAILTAIALCITGTALAPAGASAQDPILFVHGYVESASLWNTMIGRLRKRRLPEIVFERLQLQHLAVEQNRRRRSQIARSKRC